MTAVSHKIAVREKGQQTARSTDVYLPKAGLKETAICRECHLIYRNKRWYLDAAEGERLMGDRETQKGICPACRRAADNMPAGIVTLSGPYLVKHAEEIINMLRHIENKSREKNPLGRIMEIREEPAVFTITTTEDKLAQKLGREIFRAHKGELNYRWNHEEKFVRVAWNR